MMQGMRRTEFSERLAEILGLSRRDLRFRVTLMVTDGLIPPGRRGPGAPPATPGYAADLLIGAMAAPQQAQTVDAIRCYRALEPVAAAGAVAPGVVVGRPGRSEAEDAEADPPLLPAGAPFGEALARLIDLARDEAARGALARGLFGVWVSRGFPVAAVQLASWSAGRRAVVTRRYELAPGARPPAWLDPDRGGLPDPGLFHTVFLPAGKLVDIGVLTSPEKERKQPVIRIGKKIAKLADLARSRRHRPAWEKFLAFAEAAQTAADKIEARPSRLTEVAAFGSNPGNLHMLTYVPPGLPAGAPLVVVLHGCTQTAASYDYGTGWTTLADRHGFAVLLPQQSRTNNPLRCFNWFRGEDNGRGNGEALSIRQMVDRMVADHGLDAGRVYVTGLSAGGAMTSVMLATYPDVFAGGAIVAAVPYKCADGLQEAFEVIFQGKSRPAAEWGGLVRAASPHRGPWPRVSVWHGTEDSAVKPLNADEVVKQWTDVHGLPATPAAERTVDGGHRHRVWHGPDGAALVESYTVAGMGHGQPVDPDGPDGCGNAAPYIHAMGLSSAHHIAAFWGLTDTRFEAAAEPRPAREAPPPRPDAGAGTGVILVDRAGGAEREQAPPRDEPREEPREEPRRDHGSGRARSGGAPGIDVAAIVAKSLELAGQGAGAAKGGVDVSSIVAKSLEIAGMAAGAGAGGGAAAGPTADDGSLAGSGWEGDGWQRLAADPQASQGGPQLHGYASSGIDCATGNAVRWVSREMTLGLRPVLRYARRLDLRAAVNPMTTAGFTVLVDGVPVDEVSVVGMDYAEAEWTERTDIDLAKFADRTVTLTFEVAANSNVCLEVFAKAWLAGIAVHDAEAPAEA